MDLLVGVGLSCLAVPIEGATTTTTTTTSAPSTETLHIGILPLAVRKRFFAVPLSRFDGTTS
jgi:hypothetical protein